MTKIYVKVKPNSSEQKVVRFGDFRFLVYVKSAPENDKANIEMINLLSKHLGVPPKSLKITFGRTSNDKILEINY